MGNFSFGYVPGKYTGVNTKTNETTTQEQTTPKVDTKTTFINKYELKRLKREIISKVSIPMYFKEVIIPQLPGYYDLYPVDFDNDPRACCPLHDEDTPSFRYYEDTHSFYCFGCQKGGRDITVLHRMFAERLNGREVEEEEAIGYLYNYFIRGKNVGYLDTFNPIVEEEHKEEKEKITDKMRFTAAENQFEKAVTSDPKLSIDTKKEMWHTADTLDTLVSLSMVSAIDAKLYLEEKIQKHANKE